MIVRETILDMLNPNNYICNGVNLAYDGMLVLVTNDPCTSNNAAYFLNNKDNISNISSWKKVVPKDDPLDDINRLKDLLRESIDVLRKHNLIFEIFEDVGITREEYNELYEKH